MCVGNTHLLLALPEGGCSVRCAPFYQAIWRGWADGGSSAFMHGRNAAIADQQLDVGVFLLGRI